MQKVENGQLWKDIDVLNYYDHTLLTKTAHSAKDMFGDFSEDATISSVVTAMSSLGLDEDDESEDEREVVEISGANIRSESLDEDARWAPHGSKMHTSSLGNYFYMNHPIDLLDLDLLYLSCGKAENHVNEIKPEQLTPMWADWKGSPSKHFYVNEVAQLRDGQFVIPLCWVTFKRDGVFILQDPQMECIPASRMKYNFFELEQKFSVLKFSTYMLSWISGSDEWDEAYDCQIQSEIMFQIHGHLLPADNPQQAESNSNAGANANQWCHGDDTGGTADGDESDGGYHTLFGHGAFTQRNIIIYLEWNLMEIGKIGGIWGIGKIGFEEWEEGLEEILEENWGHLEKISQ
ncbi:hypothetical protein BU17DRAFT_66490 [Hysterangium stoloniferum]|nr:hypothetical protein BU17DRAFT_66490 [Hysterangium stoloniferum]